MHCHVTECAKPEAGHSSRAGGSDAGQYANTTSNNAQWSVQQYDGSYYRIQNRATGLYLDGMGRTTDGAACGQYANTTHSNAQWQLVAVSSSARMDTGERTVADEESASVRVHPNPATNETTIEVPPTYEGEKVINLVDGMGKVTISDTFNESQHTLYIGKLPSGMYILKVTNNKKLIVEKVIKR